MLLPLELVSGTRNANDGVTSRSSHVISRVFGGRLHPATPGATVRITDLNVGTTPPTWALVVVDRHLCIFRRAGSRMPRRSLSATWRDTISDRRTARLRLIPLMAPNPSSDVIVRGGFKDVSFFFFSYRNTIVRFARFSSAHSWPVPDVLTSCHTLTGHLPRHSAGGACSTTSSRTPPLRGTSRCVLTLTF